MYEYEYNYDIYDKEDDLSELWKKQSEPKEPAEDTVKEVQLYLSRKGYAVAPTGIKDDSTYTAIIKYLQFQLGYYGAGSAVTGKLDNDTIIKGKRFLPLKKSGMARPKLIIVMKLALLYNGYAVSLDTAFSKELESTIMVFQKDNDIPETGIINSETFITLFEEK